MGDVDKPQTQLGPKEWASGCGCLVVLLVAVMLAVAMCSAGGDSGPPYKNEEGEVTVAKADPAIRRVTKGVDRLTVDAYFETAWDDAGYVNQVGMLAENVGRALQAGAIEDFAAAENIDLVVSVAGTDRLGEDVELPFMVVTLPAEDLRRANFANLTRARVLNLATEARTTSGAGRRAVAQWCGKDDYAADAMGFCLRVLS